MRKSLLLAAAAATLLSAISPSAFAAEEAKPKAGAKAAAPAPATAPPKPSPEEQANMRTGALILRTFTVAIQSEEVQPAVKGQLILCMYNNKLRDITAATLRVFANNPELKADNSATLYRAAAAVCGVRFKKVDEAAAPAPKPPAKSGTAKPANGESR